MAQQVLEGIWEEVAAHADELTGKRVKVIVEAESGTAGLQPNFAMLNTMREAHEIQQGMNPRRDSDCVAILREGRRGGMYGREPLDE